MRNWKNGRIFIECKMAKFLSSWPTDFTNGNPVYKLFKLLSWNKSTVKWFQHTVKTRKKQIWKKFKMQKTWWPNNQKWALDWTWIGLDRTMTNFVEFELDPDCKTFHKVWPGPALDWFMEKKCIIFVIKRCILLIFGLCLDLDLKFLILFGLFLDFDRVF